MFAVQPVKIYPNIPICQIFYHEICGDINEYCSEKYQNNKGIQPSMLHKELNPGFDALRVCVVLEGNEHREGYG